MCCFLPMSHRPAMLLQNGHIRRCVMPWSGTSAAGSLLLQDVTWWRWFGSLACLDAVNVVCPPSLGRPSRVLGQNIESAATR